MLTEPYLSIVPAPWAHPTGDVVSKWPVFIFSAFSPNPLLLSATSSSWMEHLFTSGNGVSPVPRLESKIN